MQMRLTLLLTNEVVMRDGGGYLENRPCSQCYPNAMIRFVCARLAMEMEEPLWFYIRKRITLNPPLCP